MTSKLKTSLEVWGIKRKEAPTGDRGAAVVLGRHPLEVGVVLAPVDRLHVRRRVWLVWGRGEGLDRKVTLTHFRINQT